MTLLIMLFSNTVVLNWTLKRVQNQTRNPRELSCFSILLTWVFIFCKGGLDKFPHICSHIQYLLISHTTPHQLLTIPQNNSTLKWIYFHLPKTPYVVDLKYCNGKAEVCLRSHKVFSWFFPEINQSNFTLGYYY